MAQQPSRADLYSYLDKVRVLFCVRCTKLNEIQHKVVPSTGVSNSTPAAQLVWGRTCYPKTAATRRRVKHKAQAGSGGMPSAVPPWARAQLSVSDDMTLARKNAHSFNTVLSDTVKSLGWSLFLQIAVQ